MGSVLDNLNDQQRSAVLESIDNNIVLVAGAGSGKTHTLVTRVQYLIDHEGVLPENIMLVTFTNKAAKEMSERVAQVTDQAHKMWIGTFHRICVRILRKFGEHMYIKNFSIIDADDQKRLIRRILKDKGVDYNPSLINAIRTRISGYKTNLIKPAVVLQNPKEDKIVAEAYKEYQKECWQKRSFDFDDLMLYALMLLTSYEDVSNWFHNNIKYMVIDEAQDCNSIQFRLINNIIGNNNVMLCGDVNQSIYAFRNARPEYMENFANTHKNTKIMKLEQNYRSTKNIISAANEVIRKNAFGTKVEMFCDNGEGDKIQVFTASDSTSEAKWVASEILMNNYEPKDIAVIYRANYQSRTLETEFNRSGIPFMIFGGQSFYSRKEVKDLLAFCKCAVNHNDENAYKRAFLTIKKLGESTVGKIVLNAEIKEVSIYDSANDFLNSVKKPNAMHVNLRLMLDAIEIADKCSDVIDRVLHNTSYRKDLLNLGTDESREKLGYMDEFHDFLVELENKNPDWTMQEVIDYISLFSDAKGDEKRNMNAVKLMTAHASKGLEFKCVFIIGAEEQIFPHKNAIMANDNKGIEEERRLFYVAMTRAKEKLYITKATTKYNNSYGVSLSTPSRFLKEIPDKYIEEAI